LVLALAGASSYGLVLDVFSVDPSSRGGMAAGVCTENGCRRQRGAAFGRGREIGAAVAVRGTAGVALGFSIEGCLAATAAAVDDGGGTAGGDVCAGIAMVGAVVCISATPAGCLFAGLPQTRECNKKSAPAPIAPMLNMAANVAFDDMAFRRAARRA
jgi:hypothetical protein